METDSLTVGELASHSHPDIAVYGDEATNTNHRETYRCDIVDSSAKYVPTGLNGGATGDDLYHNNIAPCVGAYLWQRKS